MIAPSPIMALLRRELLAHLRLKRVFFMAAMVVAGMATIYGVTWPEDTDQTRSGALLYQTTVLMAFALCMLTVPGLACASVTSERQNESLDMLRMTGLASAHIIAAKLLNATVLILLMAVLALPMLSSLYFLTGLDRDEISRAIAGFLVTVMLCGLGGVAAGAWVRNPVGALIAAYGLSATLIMPTVSLGYWLVSDYIFGRYNIPHDFVLRSLSPISLAMGGSGNTPMDFSWAIAYYFLLVCVLWWMAAKGLRRSAGVRRAPKVIHSALELRARRRRFPFYLVDPRSPVAPIEDWENPFLVRETRWGWVGRATVMWRQFYISLIFYGTVLYYTVLMSFQEVLDATPLLYLLQTGIPLFAAVLYTCNVMTKDHDTGNFDAIRGALVPPTGIFRGKIFSVVMRLAPILASILIVQCLLLGAVIWSGDTVTTAVLVLGMLILLNNLALTIAICALAGALLRSGTAALMTSIAVVLCVQFGPVLFGMLIRSRLFYTNYFGPTVPAPNGLVGRLLGRYVVETDQAYILRDSIEFVFAPGMNYFYGLVSYPLDPWRIMLWGGVNLFYVVLVGILFQCAKWQFSRRLRRDG